MNLRKPPTHPSLPSMAVFVGLATGACFDRRQLRMVIRQQLLGGVLALLVGRVRVLEDLAKEGNPLSQVANLRSILPAIK